jgi:hypothetical protein
VFGDHGLIGSLGNGAVHVSMSTISVALSERLAAAHANGGQRFVAAPVFGRLEAAAAGKLSSSPRARRTSSTPAGLSSRRLGSGRFPSAMSPTPRTSSSSAAIS